MTDSEGDDRMHLSDEKPVEEVIADAAEEIRKRDERIKELEGEVDSLKRVQQKIHEVADKALKATGPRTKEERKELPIAAEIALFIFAVVVFGGGLSIDSCVKQRNETMVQVEAAAQKPPLTLAQLAYLADQKVHDSWPDYKVLLIGNGKMQLCNLVRVDEDVYDILGKHFPNSCSMFCHGSYPVPCNVILEESKLADVFQEVQQRRMPQEQKIKALRKLIEEPQTERVER